MTRLLPYKLIVPLLLSVHLIGACATRGHEMTKNLLQGNDAALNGDYAAAVNHYELALKSVPDSTAAKRNLGIVFVKVGNYKKAKAILAEVISSYPKDLEVYYFLGEALRGLEEFQSAAAQYQRALRINPNDLRVIKALAWTWYKLGLYERSLAIMSPVLQSTPGDLQVRLIVGSTLNKQKRYRNAIDTLSVVEKSNFKIQSRDKITAESERALIMTALAEAYAGQENCSKATLLYGEVLKARPFLSTALTGAAKCDLKQNATTRAVFKLERATKADPDLQEAHFLLGRIFEKTDPTKAIFYYRRFLLLARDNVEFAAEKQVVKSALGQLEKKPMSGQSR